MTIESIYKRFLECTEVSIDSRTLKPGAFFIALRGPSFDGNKYAAKAIEKGALYALVDDPQVAPNSSFIYVPDTLKSLQDLARLHRKQLQIPVMGITGSNGKTTTKEILATVLSVKYKLSCTLGNYNNHIGVPLTLLRTPLETEFLIVEMGSNQPGDIALLCDIARPNAGLITNIGAAHLEKLTTIEGVFEEKRSLFDYIRSTNGHFFLNRSDPFLKSLEIKDENISYYSHQGGSFGRLTIQKHEGNHLMLSWEIGPSTILLDTKLFGAHNLENIAAVLSVGDHYGINEELSGKAISSYEPQNMRSQIVETDRNILIVDAYNANPTSMKACIKSVIQENPREKVVLIIGDMLELGEDASNFHQEIVDYMTLKQVQNAFLVGDNFLKLGQKKYPVFSNTDQLKDQLVLKNIAGKIILIKASRGVKLEKIIEDL